MAISEIELRFLINNIKEIIDDVYYVSNVSPITKNSLVMKFHHSQKNDISLLISTFGICITKYKYSIIEDNETIKKIKSELERSRLIDISIVPGERIIKFLFQNIIGKKYFLIVELFGNGNIILCDDSLKILNLINPINVRHRILRPGLNYFPPPPRGVDPLSIDFDAFLATANSTKHENIDIKRWLGRHFSISKKFVEVIANDPSITNKKINELTQMDLKNLFDDMISLIKNISNGLNHEPCIIVDEDNNPIEISPVIPHNIPIKNIKKFESYLDAIDEFLNYIITINIGSKNSEIEKQIEALEHDLHEQEKAKNLVILKSTRLRDFANLLMQETEGILNIEKPYFQKLLLDFNAKILNIKGKMYLEIADEKIQLDLENTNVPKLSSSLFNIAKEMERGLMTIESSYSRILEKINKIKQQKSKKPLSEVKLLTNKEWYEKYRWFFTSDDLLAIGGRDSSSNSVLVRKHLTENDYVFHAEIHGSPFFILKNAISDSVIDISQSISEVAQATVSFSRSWKDALSSSDAYWIFSSQVKKGAPTGQYMPKGSFIIEGKRNFVKDIEIKLSIGISFINDRPLFIVGPHNAIKKRSTCLRGLLPSGLDVVKAAKKIKSDFVDYAIKNSFRKNIIDNLKYSSIDEIIRILPVGQFKLSSIEKGELKYDLGEIEK